MNFNVLNFITIQVMGTQLGINPLGVSGHSCDNVKPIPVQGRLGPTFTLLVQS